MVSKVAVIALVSIIAVPILLGYALNLTETTVNDYRGAGDSVIVSQLLQNDTGSTYTNADSYQLNTKTIIGSMNQGGYIYPVYTNRTLQMSSLYGRTEYGSWGNPGSEVPLPYFHHAQRTIFNQTASSHVNMNIKESGTIVQTIQGIYAFNYDDTTKTLVYQYQGLTWDTDNPRTGTYTCTANTSVSFTKIGSWSDRYWAFWDEKTDNHHINAAWVDFTSGFYLENTINKNSVIFPSNTRSVLYTLNLDSITAANYTIGLSLPGVNNSTLTKTTTGGVVNWQLTYGYPLETVDLYYEPSRSDNTYQFYVKLEEAEIYDEIYRHYDVTYEIRYVGSWPKLIGEANYYKVYSSTYQSSSYVSDPKYLTKLEFNFLGTGETRTPTVRIDDALFKAYDYPVIRDQEYNPSTFRTTPRTTISDVTQFGNSLSFGGNTYTVSKDGKITLGSHSVPVNNLVLSSVPNEYGTYDNKIGNTTVSTTATPSSINFGGAWAAVISTESLESYSYNTTEWHVGHFGWDGMDQNFLIVGLITCLGVFVGLGIYARKSRSGGIIPLMIVTGCAAAVFFIML